MEAVLDRWFAETAEACSGDASRFLLSEKDRFRNPVGHVLKENLAVLLQELLGEMDPARTAAALGAIGRLHAVQDLTAEKAVGFIFFLRAIMRETAPQCDVERLDARIDQLALIAFEGYADSIRRMCEIRVGESRRAMAVPAALSQRRS